MSHTIRSLTIICLVAASLPTSPACAADELFVATPLTQEKEFTGGIEGPACDRDGNVYAVNYGEQGTIGRVTPDGKGEVWVKLPDKSVGNGIRFDRAGMMYVADYAGHNVLRIDPKTKQVTVFAHEETMNQPNDLAISTPAIPTGARAPARSGRSTARGR